jgi:alpha-amylase/alpha-mannosidase (GH57 family)
MKTTYTFTVLRYVHDVTTGEFANVGVALYAPEAKYLDAMCTQRYGRLSKMFLSINDDHFRSLMRFIQARFDEHAEKVRNELALEGLPKSVLEIATAILPADDSSMQWSEPGGGITENPSRTLEQLYVRMVQRYEDKAQLPSRSDEEIWREFKKELDAKRVAAYLHPKRIVAKDYDYEFEHARKNEIWHAYEPVSFDLMDVDTILDKANRWLGRIMNLHDAEEKFKVYMLLGEPRLEKLKAAFGKAKNMLNKMPGDKEFIPESEVVKFSADLAEEIAKHRDQDAEEKVK